MRFSFCTALSQWENQDYVEKNRIEGLMHRVTELLLDIVRKATWYWAGRSPGNDLSCCHGQLGQADHGMHSGDESGHDSRVHRWAKRNSIGIQLSLSAKGEKTQMGCLRFRETAGRSRFCHSREKKGSAKNSRFSVDSSDSAPHTALRRPLTRLMTRTTNPTTRSK